MMSASERSSRRANNQHACAMIKFRFFHHISLNLSTRERTAGFSNLTATSAPYRNGLSQHITAYHKPY